MHWCLAIQLLTSVRLVSLAVSHAVQFYITFILKKKNPLWAENKKTQGPQNMPVRK